MKRNALLVCVIFALALPHAANAQSCTGTTVDLIECNANLLDQADADLNAVYRQVMAQAKAGGYDEALRAAQRLWIPYRDAACDAAAAPYAGGSIQPLIRISCLTDLTQKRTQELRAMMQN